MTRAFTTFLSRMNVATRISGGFGLILLFVAAITAFALQRVDVIGQTVDGLVHSGAADSAMADVRASLVIADRAAEHFLRTRNNEDNDAAKRALTGLESSLVAAETHVGSTSLIANGIGPIRAGIAAYRRSFESLAGLVEQLAATAAKTEALGAKVSLSTGGILTAAVNTPELQGKFAPFRLPGAVEAMRVSVVRYTMTQSTRDANNASTTAKDALAVAEEASVELGQSAPRVRTLAEAIKAGVADNQAIIGQLVKLTQGLLVQQTQLAATSAEVEAALRTVSNKLGEARAAKGRQTAAAAADAWRILIAAGIAALTAGAALAWVLSRSVSVPLTTMTKRMNSLARGDLDALIPGEGRRDEIGQMAKAVVVFRDGAIENQQLSEAATRERAAAEAERARNEADRAEVAERQAGVVAELAAGLADLAGGDLTGRMQAFPEDYKKLETDFNVAISKLQETITAIAGNSQGIHSGAGEISQAADDLSRRTEQQAASLEETAAALDEITATVRKTAEGAKHASQKRCRALRTGRAGCGSRDGGDREIRAGDQPDHRRNRRDRLPDQPPGAERRG
jgi:methyl-accepting chemotaxis protein